jgi:hypothetical protein
VRSPGRPWIASRARVRAATQIPRRKGDPLHQAVVTVDFVADQEEENAEDGDPEQAGAEREQVRPSPALVAAEAPGHRAEEVGDPVLIVMPGQFPGHLAGAPVASMLQRQSAEKGKPSRICASPVNAISPGPSQFRRLRRESSASAAAARMKELPQIATPVSKSQGRAASWAPSTLTASRTSLARSSRRRRSGPARSAARRARRWPGAGSARNGYRLASAMRWTAGRWTFWR